MVSKADKLRQKQERALAVINAILDFVGTEKLPTISLHGFEPLAYLMQLIKDTCGVEKVTEIVGKVLSTALTPLEYAIKIQLIANLKGIINCTLNPFIPYDVLENGIILELDKIDVLHLLDKNPLECDVNRKEYFLGEQHQKSVSLSIGFDAGYLSGTNSLSLDTTAIGGSLGKFYYFGCEDFQYPSEVIESNDFNAFLWFAKRYKRNRYVWLPYDKDNKDDKKNILARYGHGSNKPHLDLYGNLPNSDNFNELNTALGNAEAVIKYIEQYLKDNKNISTEYRRNVNDYLSIIKVFKNKIQNSKQLKEKTYQKLNDKGVIVFGKCLNEDFREMFPIKEKMPDGFSINSAKFIFHIKVFDSTIDRENAAWKKDDKRDGILTIEYSPYGTNFLKSNGKSLVDRLKTQSTSNPSYHVMIGNTMPLSSTPAGINTKTSSFGTNMEKTIQELENKMNSFSITLGSVDSAVRKVEELIEKSLPKADVSYTEDGNKNTITEVWDTTQKQEAEDYKTQLKQVRESIEKNQPLQTIITTFEKIPSEDSEPSKYTCTYNSVYKLKNITFVVDDNILVESKSDIEKKLKNAKDTYYTMSKSYNYPDIKQNYYYRRTLLEFNTDYVMSLKLFDGKVVFAQLIDALTNVLSINFDVSLEDLLIREKVKHILERIETSETLVDDSYFVFSNEEQSNMLQTAQYRQQQKYLTPDGQSLDGVLNADNIINSLEELYYTDSQKIENTNVIETKLNEILSHDSVNELNSENITAFDFIQLKNALGIFDGLKDRLLETLAECIVRAIISPKLYMLMCVNMEILGKEKDFNMEAFLKKYQTLMADLIQTIYNQLKEVLTQEVLKLIRAIIKKFSGELFKEQREYYERLYMKCLSIYNRLTQTSGWNMADINYADIYPEEEAIVETKVEGYGRRK